MTSVWACESCSKTFSRKGDLNRHMHIHTGSKPFICRDCGKAFAQFAGLKTHANVHTKVKPFACGMDGCTAVFGDPSSCTRHRKERHQTIGVYECPVSHCTSRIKRRSAFRHHLRKHRIDPDVVDIDALAPTVLPRQMFERRKLKPCAPIDHKTLNTTSETFCTNSTPYAYDTVQWNPPSFNATSQYSSGSCATDEWFSAQPRTLQSLEMPAIPTDELYTISAAPSPPDLDFSMSPSPTPSQNDLVHTSEVIIQSNIISRPHGANHLAPHSLPSPSPTSSLSPPSRLSPLFFSEPTPTEYTQKPPNWGVESLLFGNFLVPRFL